ncbi:MAG: calcium/proton exchanger [Thermoanaerobaculia bacterium]
MKWLIRIGKVVLLAMIPLAIWLQFGEGNMVARFVVSALAVLPIAAWIGTSTEHLAVRMGPTYGALFNATFGNFAEMVIAILAIRAGLPSVVKASFTGSILGNLLFVGGLSMIAGGWGRERQCFNMLAAESNAGQLVVAAASLVVPTLFFSLVGGNRNLLRVHEVSIGTAVILMVTYAAGLWFAFKTHQHILNASADDNAPHHSGAQWSVRRSILVLLGSSVLMGVVAEGLVGAVEHVGHQLGMNQVFLGFVVVAVVGNAAEHSTAIMLARRDRMDAALGIVMQSSVQIALFVTPLVVFLSYPLGHPLDLVFTSFEVVALALGIAIFSYAVINGESHWFEGVQLLALYLILAVAIFFLP